MGLQPIYLHHEFEHIVNEVSKNLTLQLQSKNKFITGVHYMYGHMLEIVNQVQLLSSGSKATFDKYPLVAFLLDSKVTRRDKTQYGQQNVHIVIINQCKDATGNETAKQRDENNFVPILTPIYMELIKQISLRGDMFLGMQGESSVIHDMTNRYYWGKSELFANTKNIFNDRVDAIEIENMQLTINLNYCPKGQCK